MKQEDLKSKNILILAPFFGIIFFVLLYLFASLLYPGGSQVDNNSIGFSWLNNYWCNLLNDKAINGQPNPAKPIALTGMFVLCLALSLFCFLFPILIIVGKRLKLIIQVSGSLAAIIGFFLFSKFNHDLITNLASIFVVIAAIGILIGLHKTRRFELFIFGLFNILLVGANNYVYHKEGLIVYLPVIQKITFATFLTWICFIDIQLYNISKRMRVRV